MDFFKAQAAESLMHAQQAGEILTGLEGHPTVNVAPIKETHQHSIGALLRESLEHEQAAVALYKGLLDVVADRKHLPRGVRAGVRLGRRSFTPWRSLRCSRLRGIGLLFVTAALIGLGCSSAPEKAPADQTVETTPKTELTIYSGRGESLVGPLFERIPDDAPFTVSVQYGKNRGDGHALLYRG